MFVGEEEEQKVTTWVSAAQPMDRQPVAVDHT
jgi:hypothetical protein